MTILVTGGAGYIGSHVVKILMQQGYDPIVLDSLEAGHRDAVLSKKFYQIDIRNREALENLFTKESINCVMHFAGYLSVPESVQEPQKYYDNNIAGTLNLLSAMRKGNCNKIIFSSSAAVYGEPQESIISEEHVTQPINPYGYTKLVVENILQSYFSAYGMSSVSLRYFCAAGADPDGDLGERHNPETHVIPLLLRAALSSIPFSIYGDDYPTPDGTCIRDFVHVTDIADAHVRAIQLLEKPICTSLNLGSEKGYSIKKLIDAAQRITGKNINTQIKKRRAGDPHTLVASSQKAKKLLEWNPTHSDLHTILSTALQFFENHPPK